MKPVIKLEISILFAILFCTALSLCGFSQECERVRGEVFRLHVLANSDSEEDQTIKLKVRDKILALSEDIFAEASTKDDAITAAQNHLSEFQKCAEDELYALGCNYPVTVEIGDSAFNTRTYGEVTLPAGTYPALRVKIGSAEGKNWWCVMFPQLCLPAAEETVSLKDYLTEEEISVVTGGEKYEFKFKCVEYYEMFKEKLGL